MKNVKKLVSVLLCVALMASFLCVISYAGSIDEGQAAEDGKLLEFIANLFKNVDWSKILTILVQTFKTIFSMIGIGGAA